jgi:hypothetical protein
MKTTLFAAAALSILAAAPALAQAPAAAPAPAPAAAPEAAPAAAGALSVENTPIETIAANPAGKAVLDKDLPGLTSHEAYDQFKSMTLSQVAPMSQGALDDAKLKALQEEFDKIK